MGIVVGHNISGHVDIWLHDGCAWLSFIARLRGLEGLVALFLLNE